MNSRLYTDQLTLGYRQKPIIEQLSLPILDNQLSIIIGPNGCGKSTLLRALCRLLRPWQGQVILDGKNIQQIPTKKLATLMALLPQQALVPENITVLELISRGRYPHQGFLQQWSHTDQQAIDDAMIAMDITPLADSLVDQLSGGQRQRVWIAMALAQQTPFLFLDEPTTWLDIAHQIELLEFFVYLHHQKNYTLIAVLHDINQACRYADQLIVMRAGKVIAHGAPNAIVTAELIEFVFDLPCLISEDPISHKPMIIPYQCSYPHKR